MYAITNNWVDFAFVALVIGAILLYVGVFYCIDRKGIQFTSLKQAFNELDKDDRPYTYVEDDERRDDRDYQDDW